MAGRRVALKAIDWVAFAERVPPNQRGMFNALKTRSDAVAAKLVFHQQQALESQLHSCQNWSVMDVFFFIAKKQNRISLRKISNEYTVKLSTMY